MLTRRHVAGKVGEVGIEVAKDVNVHPWSLVRFVELSL